jgi:phosphatidylserine/phosphatidylglycerophosphate/cardiolipin synthase-like enzyme
VSIRLKHLLALFIVLGIPQTHSQVSQIADIEIVESTPVGTVLDNPDIRNTQEVWLEMIGRAQQTLDIEQFYISNEPGKLLEGVLSSIYAAADRGVRVRIIVDAGMYKTYPASVDSLGRHRNIEARRIDYGAVAGGIQHSKYFVVDGKESFIGSQNFDWRALEHIHELGLRINSREIAAAFEEIFKIDWRLTSLKLEEKGLSVTEGDFHTPIRLECEGGSVAVVMPTFSPRGYIPDPARWDERAIVELISHAQNTLTLQFLSYSPLDRRGGSYGAIDGAVREAAKRGVKVRMIVSDWEKGSPAVGALKSLGRVPNVEVAFSSIPDWSGGYIPYARVEHCKYIVADGEEFWLGTSNCERSYFYSSRNVGVICASTRLAGTLAKIFQKSWNSPYRESIRQDTEYPAREHGERK